MAGTGSTGGRGDADAWCKLRADAGDQRIRNKKWVAWLSISAEYARFRIGATDAAEGRTAFEYRLVNNEVAFPLGFNFKKDVPRIAINLDETAKPVPAGARVWSGTTKVGDQSGEMCDDWNTSDGDQTGTTGATDDTQGWTKATSAPSTPCDKPQRVYCFEVD